MHHAKKIGINDLIVDPGIGFAKNTNQNFTILKHLDYFNIFELPILLGVSRKSMILKNKQWAQVKKLNGMVRTLILARAAGNVIINIYRVVFLIGFLDQIPAQRENVLIYTPFSHSKISRG